MSGPGMATPAADGGGGGTTTPSVVAAASTDAPVAGAAGAAAVAAAADPNAKAVKSTKAKAKKKRKRKRKTKGKLKLAPVTVPVEAEPDFGLTEHGTYIDHLHGVRVGRGGFQIVGRADSSSSLASGNLDASGDAGNAEPVDPALLSNADIGVGDIEEVSDLGQGSGGFVRLVRLKKDPDTLMALKVIRLEINDEMRTRIIHELKVLHECDSPWIVDFRGAFFADGDIHICMEYMDGGSLLDIYTKAAQCTVAGPRLPENVLAKASIAMLKGLCYLKNKLGIMHRDIKPANALINTKGEIKLCDLGVSGTMENSLALSHVGTMTYMAPERIESHDAYTIHADVWSLGLTVLELAIGYYPYPPRAPGEEAVAVRLSMFDLLEYIVHREAPSLPDDSNYSDTVRSFIDTCLAKEQAARPNPNELLSHPLVEEWENAEVDVGAWVRSVLEESAAAARGGASPGNADGGGNGGGGGAIDFDPERRRI